MKFIKRLVHVTFRFLVFRMAGVIFALSCLFSTLHSSVFAENSREFKIGVSAPLSGDLARIGEDVRRGLELAIKDFSDSNVQFTLFIEDDQYKGVQAASAAKKLLHVDKVDAIISLWDMSEVIAPVAEKMQTPHFAIRWNPHIAEKYSYTMTIESTYIPLMI
jgi:ABC-type branched-subunit amino acid transport system substrate-binding protein